MAEILIVLAIVTMNRMPIIIVVDASSMYSGGIIIDHFHMVVPDLLSSTFNELLMKPKTD